MVNVLNPRLLDLVEVPANLLGGERPGSVFGTVLELFGEGPDRLLVEVTDESGVPSDFVSVDPSKVKKLWTSPQLAEGRGEPVDAKAHYERGILLLQNGLALDSKTEFQ